MSGRGGKRPGAGRPKGSRRKTTTLDQANMILNAQELAQVALDTLAEIAANGESEGARIAASIHLLDRAFGKAVAMQQVQVSTNPLGDKIVERINNGGMQSWVHALPQKEKVRHESEEESDKQTDRDRLL